MKRVSLKEANNNNNNTEFVFLFVQCSILYM